MGLRANQRRARGPLHSIRPVLSDRAAAHGALPHPLHRSRRLLPPRVLASDGRRAKRARRDERTGSHRPVPAAGRRGARQLGRGARDEGGRVRVELRAVARSGLLEAALGLALLDQVVEGDGHRVLPDDDASHRLRELGAALAARGRRLLWQLDVVERAASKAAALRDGEGRSGRLEKGVPLRPTHLGERADVHVLLVAPLLAARQQPADALEAVVALERDHDAEAAARARLPSDEPALDGVGGGLAASLDGVADLVASVDV
mmetsp:Transcript_31855/g.104322  ORF Transcript_31855/g.104322 Transcript_31855/m.104322 type:complete len:262 (+) Transcript_31855:164-949(+)